MVAIKKKSNSSQDSGTENFVSYNEWLYNIDTLLINNFISLNSIQWHMYTLNQILYTQVHSRGKPVCEKSPFERSQWKTQRHRRCNFEK